MKISQLKDLEKDQLTKIYGVEVDTFTPEIISEIEEIGIIASSDPDSPRELDFNVMDIVVSYLGRNKKIILEVPFESTLDRKAMVGLSSSLGTDLSILPPSASQLDSDKKNEYLEEYKNILCEYTKLWLEQTNTKNFVLPVSGFYQYLIQEEIGFTPKQMSKDQYIVETYVETMDVEDIDNIKNEIRNTIYDHFEGKEKFSEFSNSVCKAAIDHANKLVKEISSS